MYNLRIAYPAKPELIKKTSGFDLNRIHPVIKKLKPHYGIDFAPKNKYSIPKIISVIDGRVIELKETEPEGIWLIVHHYCEQENKNFYFQYMHLDVALKRIGDDVKMGSAIAIMGNTGISTARHLHFQMHVNNCNNRNAIDPEPYFNINLNFLNA